MVTGLRTAASNRPQTTASWKKTHDGNAATCGVVRVIAVSMAQGQNLAICTRVATNRSQENIRLHVMAADGANVRILAESLDVRGAPAWSPDGQSIAVAALSGGNPRLFRVPLDGQAPVSIAEDYATDPSWSPDGEFLVYSGVEVGPNFAVSAVTSDGKPRELPQLTLSRGARRISFLRGSAVLVVQRGELGQGDLWLVDLASGDHRRLTSFGGQFVVGDFDVSGDGREIVFDRRADNSDILLIDRQSR